MVVIFLPSAAATGITQERTAAPSTCTVHAPHCAMPQPYLVPVRPTCSRIAHKRGVLGLTLTSSVLPLIVKRAMGVPPGIAGAGNIRDQASEGKRSCCPTAQEGHTAASGATGIAQSRQETIRDDDSVIGPNSDGPVTPRFAVSQAPTSRIPIPA